MADVLNNPGCTVYGASTGKPGCNIDPKVIIGAIVTDPSVYYDPATDFTDFKTTLQDDIMEDGKARIHPIFSFVEAKDSSEEVKIQTMGYGPKVPIQEGKYDWSFRFMKGGLCLLAQLRKFNALEKKVFFVGEAVNIGGAVKYPIFGTYDTDGYFTGFSMDFIYTNTFKISDGSKAVEYWIRFAQSKPEEWDNYAVYYADWDPEENLKGLLDLELEEVEVAAGVATIKVKTACDKVNIYDDYKTELADKDLWIVTKAGADVSISSVTADDTNEAWDIAFSGTGDHVITLETPSVLAAGDVGGAPGNPYNALTVTVTMPAS